MYELINYLCEKLECDQSQLQSIPNDKKEELIEELIYNYNVWYCYSGSANENIVPIESPIVPIEFTNEPASEIPFVEGNFRGTLECLSAYLAYDESHERHYFNLENIRLTKK